MGLCQADFGPGGAYWMEVERRPAALYVCPAPAPKNHIRISDIAAKPVVRIGQRGKVFLHLMDMAARSMRLAFARRQIFGFFALAVLAVAALPRPAHAAGGGRGKLLFLRCASCHDISAGPSAKLGPNLRGVYGRPSGSLPGYTYSPAMMQAHLVWNEQTLDRWLEKPTSVVPGTAMAFVGLPSAQDRQSVIAYLRDPGP
jgi:cytochrome c